MRQQFTIAAVNFKDLLALKDVVIRFFETLHKVPKENQSITFNIRWQEAGSVIKIHSEGLFESDNFDDTYAFIAPAGVSNPDWAMLVLAELKTYLLSCDWLRLEDRFEIIEETSLTFFLERI